MSPILAALEEQSPIAVFVTFYLMGVVVILVHDGSNSMLFFGWKDIFVVDYTQSNIVQVNLSWILDDKS
jgi:hypothetical protein